MVSSASRVRCAYVPETVIGTIPTAPTFQGIRRTTGNMTSKKTTVVSDEVQADRNVRDEYMVGLDPAGTYGFELSYASFDSLIAAALFGVWNANVLQNGVTEQSFTVEETINNSDGTQSFSRFAGTEVKTLTLAINSRQSVKGSLSLMGLQETLDTAIAPGATYVATNNNPIMTSDKATGLTVGGTTYKVRNLSVNVENNLRIRPLVGSLYSLPFGQGLVDVTGSLDVYFESNALYQSVLAHGSGAITTTIGTVSGSKYTLLIPSARFLDGARQLAGKNDDVILQVPFRGIFDPVTAASIQLTRGVT